MKATTGGTNGLTDIKSFFGYSLDDPVNRTMVYYIIAAVVLVMLVVARQLMQISEVVSLAADALRQPKPGRAVKKRR